MLSSAKRKNAFQSMRSGIVPSKECEAERAHVQCQSHYMIEPDVYTPSHSRQVTPAKSVETDADP